MPSLNNYAKSFAKAEYMAFTDPSMVELSQRLDHYVVLAQLKKRAADISFPYATKP